MKYVKKIPKADEALRTYYQSEGYKMVKEAPNLPIAFLLSLPFVFINALIAYGVIRLVSPVHAEQVQNIFQTSTWEFTIRFDYILYFYVLLIVHEILHLVFIPKFYKSDKTFYGLKLWGGFVFTGEPLSKGRFLVISLAPFVILSIVIPVVLGLLGWLSGFLVFLIFLNASASSVDLLNVVTVMGQVPWRSTTVNNGFESYYKTP